MTAPTTTPSGAERLLRTLDDRGRRVVDWIVGPGAPLAVVLLTVWSAYLRTRNLDAPLWIDEGISIGVASYPFGEIPDALRLDGNPPTYYWILHGWISLLGSTEAAVHALSAAFAVAIVPVTWLLARGPLGRRSALAATAMAAVLPYLTYFGQETRMYSMVALLSVLVAGLHLHVFSDGARLRSRIGLAAVLIVALYTHSWSVFLVGGSVVAVGVRALLQPGRAARWAVIRVGFLIHATAAVAWAPWIPTLVRQSEETGAPWSLTPTFRMLVESIGSLAVRPAQATILLTAMVFGFGALAAAARGRFRGRGVPEPELARSIFRHGTVLAAMFVAIALFAFASSLMNPAWANRYMGVLVGPLVLLSATVLTRSGRVTLGILLILLVMWGVDTQGDRLHAKGSPAPVADAAASSLRPGDLVVSIHPEQLTVVHYYLRDRGAPEGVRYATALGRQEDVRLFDWRHAMDRLTAAEPWRVARTLVDAQPEGSRVLLVLPVTSSGNWQGPWTRLVAERSRAWKALLQTDPRLRMVGRRPVQGPGRGVYGILFDVGP
ncbi:MAG: glycosyltransferase family 39 protein [Solirubrobacteraceae bacterium]|nr:glycosyltransferase family 39 protein [Solirubrobacteraceae bacterium]